MLRLYRRHRVSCGKTSEHYRRCSCPIYVEGSLAGEYIRKALDLTSWEAASDLVNGWNASGQIGVVRREIPTIKEAVAKPLADAEARNLKPESLKKIRDVMERRFLAFCEEKGYRALRQLDVDAVREFRNELAAHYSANSARKRLEYVQAFFRFVHQSGWTPVNPAPAVKPPLADDSEIETFEAEEIDRMLAVADSFNTRAKFGPGNRKRIRAMVRLLRYSGRRISDASVLARERLAGGQALAPDHQDRRGRLVPSAENLGGGPKRFAERRPAVLLPERPLPADVGREDLGVHVPARLRARSDPGRKRPSRTISDTPSRPTSCPAECRLRRSPCSWGTPSRSWRSITRPA